MAKLFAQIVILGVLPGGYIGFLIVFVVRKRREYKSRLLM